MPAIATLEVISDANLSGTRFFVFCDPRGALSYCYGGLQGPPRPLLITRAGFEVDGVEIRLSLDFGTGAVDYRAGASGAGA
jgi:hypothetical protein